MLIELYFQITIPPLRKIIHKICPYWFLEEFSFEAGGKIGREGPCQEELLKLYDNDWMTKLGKRCSSD